MILGGRFDCDRTNARDRRPFVHAIAADDLPIHFGNYAIEGGMRKYVAHHPGRRVDAGKFGREIMLAVDGGKSIVTNAAADDFILRQDAANLDLGVGHEL